MTDPRMYLLSILFLHHTDGAEAKDLVTVLREAKQNIPDKLLELEKTCKGKASKGL